VASVHASFDHWWNGISLRAKITGVTVLLLTFGLAVAGAGTMTVLKTYLMEQVDSQLTDVYNSLDRNLDFDYIDQFGDVDSGRTPYYVAAVAADGEVIEDNLPVTKETLRPDTSDLTLAHVATIDGAVTLANATKTAEWRVITSPLRIGTGSQQATLLIGISLKETNGTIARFVAIFFGFALAVVVFGAATTQLLVTSTFAPLRDVEATAARFAAGDYSQRLGGATPNTEVGRLNRSLNTMLARIDRAFADRQRTVDQMRRFVGDASHELRTPLVSLRGYAELYRMGAIQKPEDVAQAMDRIEREAIRMGGLVEDLLELARLDEAKPLQLAPVDLLPIAQDAALDAGASAPERNVRVLFVEPELALDPVVVVAEVPAKPGRGPRRPAAPRTPSGRGTGAASPTAPIALSGLFRWRRPRTRATEAPAAAEQPPLPAIGPIVMAEENKIRQVVTNLMGNAMRFTPSDSPIEIEVTVDRAGRFGQLSIVDHGEGIPPQLREKIFQRFWRADTSRTRDTGGSGLGLAIVAGIVQNHEGHVEVLETPGGGATFRVSIPLVPRPETEASSPDAAPTEKTGRTSS
jgi:two-component system OmpR family sensor kinase